MTAVIYRPPIWADAQGRRAVMGLVVALQEPIDSGHELMPGERTCHTEDGRVRSGRELEKRRSVSASSPCVSRYSHSASEIGTPMSQWTE